MARTIVSVAASAASPAVATATARTTSMKSRKPFKKCSSYSFPVYFHFLVPLATLSNEIYQQQTVKREREKRIYQPRNLKIIIVQNAFVAKLHSPHSVWQMFPKMLHAMIRPIFYPLHKIRHVLDANPFYCRPIQLVRYDRWRSHNTNGKCWNVNQIKSNVAKVNDWKLTVLCPLRLVVSRKWFV